MSDSFITLIIVLIASVLIFVVPMVAVSHQNDVITNQEIHSIITEFIDTVRTIGKVTKDDYNNLIEKINSTRIKL